MDYLVIQSPRPSTRHVLCILFHIVDLCSSLKLWRVPLWQRSFTGSSVQVCYFLSQVYCSCLAPFQMVAPPIGSRPGQRIIETLWMTLRWRFDYLLLLETLWTNRRRLGYSLLLKTLWMTCVPALLKNYASSSSLCSSSSFRGTRPWVCFMSFKFNSSSSSFRWARL